MEKITEIKKNEVTDFGGDGNFSILYTNDKVFLIAYDNFALHKGSNTKNYEHDCDKCIFLGSWNDLEPSFQKTYDLYFCSQHNLPTVVARYGNDGPDYHSGLNMTSIKPLKIAEQIAKNFKLI